MSLIRRLIQGTFIHICLRSWALLRCLAGVQPRVVLYSLVHGYVFLVCMSIDPVVLRSLLTSAQGSTAPLGANVVEDRAAGPRFFLHLSVPAPSSMSLPEEGAPEVHEGFKRSKMVLSLFQLDVR